MSHYVQFLQVFSSIFLLGTLVSVTSGYGHGGGGHGGGGHQGGGGYRGGGHGGGHGQGYPQFNQNGGFRGGQNPFLSSQFPIWNPFPGNGGNAGRPYLNNQPQWPMNQQNPLGGVQQYPGWPGVIQGHNNGNSRPEFGSLGHVQNQGHAPITGGNLNGQFFPSGGYFPFQNQYPPWQVPGGFNNGPFSAGGGPYPPNTNTGLLPIGTNKQNPPVETGLQEIVLGEASETEKSPPPLPSKDNNVDPLQIVPKPPHNPNIPVEKVPPPHQVVNKFPHVIPPVLTPTPKLPTAVVNVLPADIHTPTPVTIPVHPNPDSIPEKAINKPIAPLPDTSGDEDVDYKELLASLSKGTPNAGDSSDVDDWDTPLKTPLDIDARLNLKKY